LTLFRAGKKPKMAKWQNFGTTYFAESLFDVPDEEEDDPWKKKSFEVFFPLLPHKKKNSNSRSGRNTQTREH